MFKFLNLRSWDTLKYRIHDERLRAEISDSLEAEFFHNSRKKVLEVDLKAQS